MHFIMNFLEDISYQILKIFPTDLIVLYILDNSLGVLMKEKYDVPIAPQSEFVSYMMEQMSHFGLPCTEEQAKDFLHVLCAYDWNK